LKYSPEFKQTVFARDLFTLSDGHPLEELIMASVTSAIPFKPTALEDGNQFIERAFPRPFPVDHKSNVSRKTILMERLP
jgi:hypothetical protein